MDRLGSDEVLAIRERLAKTQEEMAALMGVAERTWRRWETEDTAGPVASRLLARMAEEEL